MVGFDIERHQYGEHKYPAQLVLQDVLTLHGSQFKDADLIVASPPCEAYSYRAMPWSRAKALPPPDNTLFEACFRIQREACEAAGRHIPLIVENVKGAQKWVGRARWNFGSFYLWGDVPALMPMVRRRSFTKCPNESWSPSRPSYTKDHAWKNTGGSWFNIGSPGQKETNRNPVNTFANAAVGRKQRGSGPAWFRGELGQMSGKSPARKAASAMIAKIPLPLSSYIARTFKPRFDNYREASA